MAVKFNDAALLIKDLLSVKGLTDKDLSSEEKITGLGLAGAVLVETMIALAVDGDQEKYNRSVDNIAKDMKNHFADRNEDVEAMLAKGKEIVNETRKAREATR